jgi:hypothetical protein
VSQQKVLLAALVAALLVLGAVPAGAAPAAVCMNRTNNTYDKLLECVTVEGVREHQAAFQAIADANGGNRAAGLPGYEASVEYVVERLEAAGWNVTLDEFRSPSSRLRPCNSSLPSRPHTRRERSPGAVPET